MPGAAAGDPLPELRRTVANIDNHKAFPSGEAGLLRVGLPAVDSALGGGLTLGAVHDLAPATPMQFGAAAGFAFALAARLPPEKQVLWIQTDFAALESGTPYGPGIDLLGLPLHRLLVLRVARVLDVLWATEEALKSSAVAAVLAELPEDAADLTATRRLSLAARAGGGLGLLLRQRPSSLPSAAITRWEIAAAPSLPDGFGGLGPTAFDLSLSRNRRGRRGRWIVSWNHAERIFIPQALSLGVAKAAADRPADPRRIARTG
jgi:protein ImuA